MRIVVLGTGPFAVPSFAALLAGPEEVVALVTRPDVQNKGRKEVVNPMRAFAEERNFPVHAPADINSAEGIELLKSLRPDLLVVCDYGQILSNEALAIPSLGGINLHGSLLPKYRGAAPINWVIWKGEQETGITVIHMTPQLDGGPALAVRSTPIGPTETTAELEPRLSQLGVDAVLESIALLKNWDRASPIGVRQDQSLATKARRLRKTDGIIRWDKSAQEIFNQVRALKPWPGTFTFWLREQGEPLRLVIDEVAIASSPSPASSTAQPGQVIAVTRDSLQVATSDGVLSLLRVQPAGKKSMPIADFLRGYPLHIGDRFGVPPGESD
jgi:methionyl-tRNA formyltransferase